MVYVYERTDSGSPWVLTATIPAPSPEFGADSAMRIDLRGDLLAVGESARGRRSGVGLPAQRRCVVAVGGWIEAEGNGFGNEFGASVAWIDDDRLAIGAPGATGIHRDHTGEVWVADSRRTGWSLNFRRPAVSHRGRRLGFVVAFDDSPAGDGRLVAGVPGASRRYEWTIGVGPIGNPGVAEFDA